MDWRRRLRDPGAEQMRHVAAAMRLWRPEQALTRQPDQALVVGDAGQAKRLTSDRLTAMRSADGSLAMIYNANGRSMRVNLRLLTGPLLEALWFDPRSGKTTAIGVFSNTGEREFVPPQGSGNGNDKHGVPSGVGVTFVTDTPTALTNSTQAADFNGTANMYIDGDLVAAATGAWNYMRSDMPLNTTAIGAWIRAASTMQKYPFLGRIDDVSIWNAALSEHKIRYLASGGNPMSLGPNAHSSRLNDGFRFVYLQARRAVMRPHRHRRQKTNAR